MFISFLTILLFAGAVATLSIDLNRGLMFGLAVATVFTMFHSTQRRYREVHIELLKVATVAMGVIVVGSNLYNSVEGIIECIKYYRGK